jgi:hypothetical protein
LRDGLESYSTSVIDQPTYVLSGIKEQDARKWDGKECLRMREPKGRGGRSLSRRAKALKK